MLLHDEFRRERDAVQSIENWNVFYRKWLNNASWPTKSKEKLNDEAKHKCAPISIGGRTWGFTFFNDDISPEARYEYFFALKSIGDPLKFPNERQLPKTAELGFSQQCPYCEISTNEIGDDRCPKCKRQLILFRSAS
jgi:hypothetical protein